MIKPSSSLSSYNIRDIANKRQRSSPRAKLSPAEEHFGRAGKIGHRFRFPDTSPCPVNLRFRGHGISSSVFERVVRIGLAGAFPSREILSVAPTRTHLYRLGLVLSFPHSPLFPVSLLSMLLFFSLSDLAPSFSFSTRLRLTFSATPFSSSRSTRLASVFSCFLLFRILFPRDFPFLMRLPSFTFSKLIL